MRRLVVCCDGTWNTPDQEDHGVPAPTNVVKIHSAVAEIERDDLVQKRFYRAGVGTSGNWFQRKTGGGLGIGLDEDIQSAYKWLCDQIESENDEIFIFGFSRGAYAARSLTGLIDICGLLDFSAAALSADEK